MVTVLERFHAKTVADDCGECIIWTASRNAKGYGHFWLPPNRMVKAHRWAYEQWRGPISEGLTLDHLCRQPSCVNPFHLEPVTNLVNHQRGKKAQQTHCLRGHPFDEENTRYHANGSRQCKRCCRLLENERRQAARRKEVSP